MSLNSLKSGRGDDNEVYVRQEVHMCNDNFYTIACEGDTYRSLSKEMGVSERRLRKYNEVDKSYQLVPGDIVYFEKKEKYADKRLKGYHHRVQEGESLHMISQIYGMRLSTLYKINQLPYDYVPSVGDLILLRK